MQALGLHIVADFYNVNADLLTKVDEIKQILEEGVKLTNLTMLDSYFHQFKPHGVTGIIVLAESHISIHTWPEYNYAALDIFVCSNFEKAFGYLDYLREKLRPMFVKKEIHLRGTNASNKS